VTGRDALLEERAEDLFEDAPCGYLSTDLDGTILRVNRTFEDWTGFRREELLGHRRFQDLLTAGGRIYHETHFAPLLRMQGSVREIAVDLVRADGGSRPSSTRSCGPTRPGAPA
jgi:phosphoserine phosphatase RsbU/P